MKSGSNTRMAGTQDKRSALGNCTEIETEAFKMLFKVISRAERKLIIGLDSTMVKRYNLVN